MKKVILLFVTILLVSVCTSISEARWITKDGRHIWIEGGGNKESHVTHPRRHGSHTSSHRTYSHPPTHSHHSK